MKRRLASAFARDEHGAAALEFAIVGNVFLIFLMSISYGAIMLWHETHLDWAVQNSSRLAAINPAVTAGAIQSSVNGYLTGLGMGPATVQYQIVTLGGVKVGQITATMRDTFTVPLISSFNINYSASANVPQP